MKHILSSKQYTRKYILDICRKASSMEALLIQKKQCTLAAGKILGAVSYEPSTRTRCSFESAMLRLGGQVVTEANPLSSSRSKGETLSDSIRIISAYCDVIALRQNDDNGAEIAAKTSLVPIINAGAGKAEHPTQSLLDIYTIAKHFDLAQASLNIAFVGDLKYGRTVHSLSTVLRHFPNVSQTFVAPSIVQMPEKYIQEQDSIMHDLTDVVLTTADVIYDTRVQKERFEDMSEYEAVKGAFVFDVVKVQKMKKTSILMHPLPRITEILPEVDELPQAKYFEQAANGVPVRMALIADALELI